MPFNKHPPMKTTVPALIILLFFTSCAVTRFQPERKFAPEALREDYRLFQSILEEAHPGLYWYTPKDSMDYFFARGENMLQDSLTEQKFRNVLSYVTAKIRCGHTSVRPSRGAQRIFDNRAPSLPLFIKTWPDTTIVTANINVKDSQVVRGVLLTSMDNRSMQQVIDSMFSHISTDGYNATHQYQALSNGSAFRAMYASLFGLKPAIPVTYIDSAGEEKRAMLRMYVPPKPDSTKPPVKPPKLSKRERKKRERMAMRSLRIDSADRYAVLEVNTFAKNNALRPFFRRSFREIRKRNIENLVVDMRGNGGGSVILSNLLTKYISDRPFKIADTLYAIRRGSHYGKYQQNRFWNWLFLTFFTHKKADGNYHFALFENKFFKPKKKNHFDGQTYILTGGNTFSAASIFAKSLQQQPGVTIVGEETGGGAYGNTAWLIPDVTLPNTGVRFRLPLFRLVVDKDAQKGRGVMPDVAAPPTVEAIRERKDFKLDKVLELIQEKAKD